MKSIFFLVGIFFLFLRNFMQAQTFTDLGFSAFNIASGWGPVFNKRPAVICLGGQVEFIRRSDKGDQRKVIKISKIN